MKRYRYITHEAVQPKNKLSQFRLYGAANLCMRNDCYLRVTIPDTVVLDKDCNCMWSTTESEILIQDLEPMPVVRINGKPRHLKDLWPLSPHDWRAVLTQKGYVRNQMGWFSPEKTRKRPC